MNGTRFARARRRATAAVVAMVAGLTLGVLPASSAQAATLRCSETQHRVIAVSRAEVEVWIEVCVKSNADGSRQAGIRISIRTVSPPGPTFYSFGLRVRLERYDVVMKTAGCSYLTQANNAGRYGTYTCSTAALSSSATGGWTGDGYLYWDTIGDGHGEHRWDLYGSPSIP